VWGAGDAAVELHSFPDDGIAVIVRAPKTALCRVRLRWDAPQSPEADVRVLGDHWERGYGDLEWRGVVPERRMPWYMIALSPANRAAAGVGVETGAAAFCWWQQDGSGYSLTLDVSNGGRGVLLGDRTLHAATIRSVRGEPGHSPFEVACALCKRLCPAPRLPGHVVYGGNDWYYAYGDNSAETIRRDAALIRDHAPNTENAPYMVIDAGWFPEKGCNGGPYDRGNDDFPDMAGLAAWMTAHGVRPGIWIRPLLMADAPAAWQLPEQHPVRRRDRGAFLDPTVPEVVERVRADIRRLRDWGYTLIKHDFTTYDLTGRWGFEMADGLTAPGWHFADRSRTTAEIVRDLYAAVREAAGDAVLIGCNTVGHLGAGLFELQRTGDDTSGREWERTRKMGVNTLAFRMPQHGAFFAADADCVGLTREVPWRLNRQWLDLLARNGTPLFVSAAPDAVGPEQSAALKEAFLVASRPQPPAEPLDWLYTTCPRHWRFGDEEAVYDWTE
jgi:alpha-galactosidase